MPLKINVLDLVGKTSSLEHTNNTTQPGIITHFFFACMPWAGII